LAERLGLIPEIPEAVRKAAEGERAAFGAVLMKWLEEKPKAKAVLPFILAQTLGEKLGSANLAALWGILMTSPRGFQENAARAGFAPGPQQGEEIFQALLDNPQGVVIGRCDRTANLAGLKYPDGRLNVLVPEMEEWVLSIEPESEEESLRLPEGYSLILNAGRHMDLNANTLMRDPAWNKGRRACTLAMNSGEAQALGLADGARVRVVTRTGQAELELEHDPSVREGTVIIPHGFGLDHEGRTYGVNVNRLTSGGHRDRLAGTPLHRYVPCRVEAVNGS
jgi:anaerobic selenocysteine-containing dehydrogenase